MEKVNTSTHRSAQFISPGPLDRPKTGVFGSVHKGENLSAHKIENGQLYLRSDRQVITDGGDRIKWIGEIGIEDK